MNIIGIIKNAFIFPSKNLETLSIYAILSLLSGAFAFEGIITVIFGLFDIVNLLVGIVCIIIAIILGLITRRISIQCIRSGIELEDKLPEFKWWESLGTGFNKIVITIFFFVVPTLITVFIGLVTNIFGNIINVAQAIVLHVTPIFMTNSTLVSGSISQSLVPLFVSLAFTLSVGLIIFLISSFFQDMAEARLAHTGSLKKALNIFGAAKDIKMIGIGKLILVSTLIFVIFVTIEFVLTFIFDHLLVLSILNIIITPYLSLFSRRALGLLYSDIV